MENKELEIKLAELETSVKTAVTKEAKEEVTKEIKGFYENHKDAIDGYAELKKSFDELKRDAEANQPIIDAFVKNTKAGINIPAEQKSLRFALDESIEKVHDDAQKFIRGEKKSFAFEMDIKAVADVSLANVTGGTVYGASFRNGIITNPNEIGHVRDFISSSPAPAGQGGAAPTDFYFMRENGTGEGAPAPTSEKQVADATTQATGLKPQLDIDLVEASVKYETIAGLLVASNKAMRSIPGMSNFLNMRLPQKLYDVEDTQVLYGNGTSPNIKGILASGNYQASTSSATVLAEAIIDDLSTLEDTYKRLANFVILRPADYWSFFKNKTSGSGEYDLPVNFVFVNGQLYASGVPVYKSTRLTAGDYIVGDRNGAEILQGETLRIELFTEDRSNVWTNQVTIRIEETIALPVYGDNYFIKGAIPS